MLIASEENIEVSIGHITGETPEVMIWSVTDIFNYYLGCQLSCKFFIMKTTRKCTIRNLLKYIKEGGYELLIIDLCHYRTLGHMSCSSSTSHRN